MLVISGRSGRNRRKSKGRKDELIFDFSEGLLGHFLAAARQEHGIQHNCAATHSNIMKETKGVGGKISRAQVLCWALKAAEERLPEQYVFSLAAPESGLAPGTHPPEHVP